MVIGVFRVSQSACGRAANNLLASALGVRVSKIAFLPGRSGPLSAGIDVAFRDDASTGGAPLRYSKLQACLFGTRQEQTALNLSGRIKIGRRCLAATLQLDCLPQIIRCQTL